MELPGEEARSDYAMAGRLETGPGLEAGLSEALSSLPRVSCPSVAIETILERGRLQRRRTVVRGTLALLGVCGLLAGSFLLRPEAVPPVHLRIRLIEAPAGGAQQVGGRPVSDWDLLVDGVPGEVEAP